MRVRTLVLGLLLVASAAHADTVQPWAVGVSDAQKAKAQQQLEVGNTLFLEKKYADALAQYREAVASWDHPAIRFNIVRCLIQLERYLDADENLKLTLKYGAAPLEEAVYTEARAYEKLLAKQVVDLEVACQQGGVRLTLDGQPLGECPTRVTRRVVPGRHQVVGVKRGFLTETVELVVVGGDRKTLDVALQPLEAAARIEHRWPTWIPWVVFGGGLAVGGMGALVQLKAASDMRAFDRDIARECDTGCPSDQLPAGAADKRELAELENKIGIAVISVGAAAAVTGGVLLYLNRGRTVYPREVQQLSVVPVRGGGAAVTWVGRF